MPLRGWEDDDHVRQLHLLEAAGELGRDEFRENVRGMNCGFCCCCTLAWKHMSQGRIWIECRVGAAVV
jgi:hypothetical protein